MKSKSILTIILLSLLLNICHDFLIEKQCDIQHTKSMTDYKKNKTITSEHQTLDIHEIFHFHGLMIKHQDVELFSKISKKMFFVENFSPQSILESSFKPPRT